MGWPQHGTRDQAGREVEGHLPGGQLGHAEDGGLHLEAPLLSLGLAPAKKPKSSDVARGSRVVTPSVALVYISRGLLIKFFLTLSRALLASFVCSRSGGEASLEGCSHDSTRCETLFGVSELFEDVNCVPSGW